MRLIRVLLMTCVIVTPFASAAVETDAPIVFLRKDCTGESECFTTIAALANWIKNVRTPPTSASDPLLVQIGPGDFADMDLEYADHVTFRGSGREVTRLGDGFQAMWTFPSSRDVTFENLTLRGTVTWEGGNSTWSDVYVRSDAYWGWYNASNCVTQQAQNAKHYWFGSRVEVLSAANGSQVAYHSSCGEHWFYGGEIRAVGGAGDGGDINNLGAVNAHGSADFRAFGAALRVDTGSLVAEDIPNAASPGHTIRGVLVKHDGIFHMHGGIINVTASGLDDAYVTGIRVGGAGGATKIAHTPGTAFILFPGSVSGTPTRLSAASPDKALSPFLWQNGTRPPLSSSESNVLESLDGADLFVEIDCASDGDCDGAGSEPHLMVYDSGCTDGWRDTVTGRCRNDANDPISALQQEVQDLDDRVTALEQQ